MGVLWSAGLILSTGAIVPKIANRIDNAATNGAQAVRAGGLVVVVAGGCVRARACVCAWVVGWGHAPTPVAGPTSSGVVDAIKRTQGVAAAGRSVVAKAEAG